MKDAGLVYASTPSTQLGSGSSKLPPRTFDFSKVKLAVSVVNDSDVFLTLTSKFSHVVQSATEGMGRGLRILVFDKTTNVPFVIASFRDYDATPLFERNHGLVRDQMTINNKVSKVERIKRFKYILTVKRLLVNPMFHGTGATLTLLEAALSKEVMMLWEGKFLQRVALVILKSISGKSSLYDKLCEFYEGGHVGSQLLYQGLYSKVIRKKAIKFLRGETDELGKFVVPSLAEVEEKLRKLGEVELQALIQAKEVHHNLPKDWKKPISPMYRIRYIQALKSVGDSVKRIPRSRILVVNDFELILNFLLKRQKADVYVDFDGVLGRVFKQIIQEGLVPFSEFFRLKRGNEPRYTAVRYGLVLAEKVGIKTETKRLLFAKKIVSRINSRMSIGVRFGDRKEKWQYVAEYPYPQELDRYFGKEAVAYILGGEDDGRGSRK